MAHPGGKLKPGRTVRFGDDSAVAIVEVLGGRAAAREIRGRARCRRDVAKYGETPLPPYIRRPPRPEDRDRLPDGLRRPTTAASPHPRPGCTSRRSCWSGCGPAARPRDRGPARRPRYLQAVLVDDLAGHAMHASRNAVSAAVGGPIPRETGSRRPHLGGRDDRGAHRPAITVVVSPERAHQHEPGVERGQIGKFRGASPRLRRETGTEVDEERRLLRLQGRIAPRASAQVSALRHHGRPYRPGAASCFPSPVDWWPPGLRAHRVRLGVHGRRPARSSTRTGLKVPGPTCSPASRRGPRRPGRHPLRSSGVSAARPWAAADAAVVAARRRR